MARCCLQCRRPGSKKAWAEKQVPSVQIWACRPIKNEAATGGGGGAAAAAVEAWRRCQFRSHVLQSMANTFLCLLVVTLTYHPSMHIGTGRSQLPFPRHGQASMSRAQPASLYTRALAACKALNPFGGLRKSGTPRNPIFGTHIDICARISCTSTSAKAAFNRLQQ